MAEFFSEIFIDEVSSSNDIVDVISEYVKLDKKGKDYFGLCPFHHEKSPSFSVVPNKQIFYCFGCNKGGSVIHFVMEIERLSFVEAVKQLAERARIPIPEMQGVNRDKDAELKKEIMEMNKEAARYFYSALYSEKGLKGREYLSKRSVSHDTAKKFGIGYSLDEWHSLLDVIRKKGFSETAIEKSGLFIKNKMGDYYDRFRGRLMFPIFNVTGSVIAFGGRIIDNSEGAKYMNSPESVVYTKGKHLYALNFVRTRHVKSLIVVEGYMDVISLYQAGCTNAVASLGTAMTEAQGRMMKKYAEEIIICYDADSAGQAATMRGLDLLKGLGCKVKVLTVTGGKDPDEYIKANGLSGFERLIEQSETLIDYKIRKLKEKSDFDTIHGKTEFLKQLSEILAAINVTVEREMYINKAAVDYNVSVDAIIELMEEREIANKRPEISTKVNQIRSKLNLDQGNSKILNKLIYDERMLLVFLCMDKRLFDGIKSKIGMNDYACEDNIQVAKIVYESIESGNEFTINNLLDKLEPELAGVFAGLFQKDCQCDDVRMAIKSKLIDIVNGKLDLEIEIQRDHLKKLDKADSEEIRKATVELQNLIIARMKR